MIRIGLLVLLAVTMLVGCFESSNVNKLVISDDGFLVNADRPKVKVYYIGNATGFKYLDYQEFIEDKVKSCQQFFLNQIGSTFIVGRHDDGKIVSKISLNHPPEYYINIKDGEGLPDGDDELWREINQKLGHQPQYSREYRLFFCLDITSNIGVCGFGVAGSTLYGSAVIFSGLCTSIEVIAHELGHAFGLYHDSRKEYYLMHKNGGGDRLSQDAIIWLNQHPAFKDNQSTFGYVDNHIYSVDNFRFIDKRKSGSFYTFIIGFDTEPEYDVTQAVLLKGRAEDDVVLFINDNSSFSKTYNTSDDVIEYKMVFTSVFPQDIINKEVEFRFIILSSDGSSWESNYMNWQDNIIDLKPVCMDAWRGCD